MTHVAEDAPKTASGTQLLDKALDMIDLVERSSQRLTATTIAQVSGYPKPTVNRILSALVRRGFLAMDRRDQSYELGMRFTQLAAALRRSHHLVTLVEEQLIALSLRTGETISLGVAEPTAVRIVGRYHMGLEAVPGGPTGAKRPYHASAIGKAILSGMPEKLAQRHIARAHFERFTASTIGRRDTLITDLQLTRARGHALDDEEILPGVRCVAVPIFATDGKVVAAVSVSAPVHRMPEERMTEIVVALNTIAAEAAKRLHVPHNDDLSDAGIVCLRSGGLFRPAAIAAVADQILVVDAAAPAVYAFSTDGSLLDTRPLSWLPSAAAIAPDGAIMLAREESIEHLAADGPARSVKLANTITALAFAPGGQGYAVDVTGSVLDARSGQHLFDVEAGAQAIAISGTTLCALAGDGQTLDFRDLASGRLEKRITFNGAPDRRAALAASAHHVWRAGSTEWQIARIDIATGTIRQIASPERGIAAIAVQDNDLLLAGANLHAVLFDKAKHLAGSLYRVAGAANA
jgi:DNA-binding IclR family transcriptional regulator